MNIILSKLVGLLLLLAGIYYLGQDIIFTNQYYPYLWKSLPAAGSVLAIVGGIICLVFFRRTAGSVGWVLLVLGIILVFVSGGITLNRTSLWKLFIGILSMAYGYKFLTEGRIRI